MRQIHKLETQEKENDQDNNEKKNKKKKIIAQVHQQYSIELLVQVMIHLDLVMLDMVQMVLFHFHDLDYLSFVDVQLMDHYSMMLMVESVLKIMMTEMMNFELMVKLNLIKFKEEKKILFEIFFNRMNLLID
jgi:hypothetical protein